MNDSSDVQVSFDRSEREGEVVGLLDEQGTGLQHLVLHIG